MKDLGHLSYFFGIEVSSSNIGYYLSRAKYATTLLARANLTDNKTTNTPLEVIEGTLLDDPALYRQLVGSLIYLTIARPDIAYDFHIVSQFMAAPCTPHFAAILRILCYVKDTIFHGLHFFANSSLILHASFDVD